MIVRNKWNGKTYTVKSFEGPTDTVTLIREDGSEFTIAQKEFRANYYEVKEDEKNSCKRKDKD